eukprot:gene41242-50878_t
MLAPHPPPPPPGRLPVRPPAPPLTVQEDRRTTIRGLQVLDPDFKELSEPDPTFSQDSDINNDNLYPFNKTFSGWQREYFRAQQTGGLLQVRVTVRHGRVMFAAGSALTFLRTPNASVETDRLSEYPDALADFEVRSSFTGAEGGTSGQAEQDSGLPRQLWWKDVTLQGRLSDLNRALALLTYWPDDNWNSATLTVLPDSSSSNSYFNFNFNNRSYESR